VEHLADCLKELGKTLISLNQNDEARKTYDECRKLVAHKLLQERESAVANLAEVYIDLGELSNAIHEAADSYQWWMNAYKTQSELVKTDTGSKPDSSENSRLADILEWLADLASRTGHAADAVGFGRESVALRMKRREVLKDAGSRNSLAFGYLWLAGALDRVGKSQEAIENGDHPIELRKENCKERSDQETHNQLVEALTTQGQRLRNSRSLADARKQYDEALKDAKDMAAAASTSTAFKRKPALRWADALESLAALDREAGDHAMALTRIDEAISQYARAISIAPDVDSRKSLASAYEQKAGLLERLGGFADALAPLKANLAMREELGAKVAGGKTDLAGAHGQLAFLHLLSGDVAAADAEYSLSLKLAQDLAAAPPNPDGEDFEARRRRAQAMESLAPRSVSCGKVRVARDAYRQALQLRKRLSDDDHSDAFAKAACRETAAGAAALEFLAGDPERAQQYSQQALAHSQELVKLDPENSGNQRSLGLDLEAAARIALQQGRFSEADAYLSQAIAVIEKLAAQQPAHVADREALARQRKWQAVCQTGAAPQAVSQRPVEVQRAWALFQAEQLSRQGKVEQAHQALEAQRTANAGNGEGLFDVARAAARCAWNTTGGKNLDALSATQNQAIALFCQQAIGALTGAAKAGFQAADKFLDPDLDIVRRTPGYRAIIATGR
jgi:tetratricopeptide (TPR) repeat protein